MFIIFILGIIFIILIYPIIESLASVLLTGLEVIKGKWSLKVAQINDQISKVGEEDKIKSPIIGFEIPNVEDEVNEIL